MNTILIITASIAILIFIIRSINSVRKKRKGDFPELYKQIFPNGKTDIDEGIKELLRILNNTIDEKTARDIFIKSSCICYSTSLSNEFSKERLRSHLLPYALHYFNDATVENFYRYLLSKNRRAEFSELANLFSQLLNPTGTDQDVMPEGFGEFGLDKTNPIPAKSIPDSFSYLQSLRTSDGSVITYNRMGGVKAPNIQPPIDAYNIFLKGNEIAIIYICPYNKKTSIKAPKGFKIV